MGIFKGFLQLFGNRDKILDSLKRNNETPGVIFVWGIYLVTSEKTARLSVNDKLG